MLIEPGWHAMGRDNAPATIMEFTDLECPFCRGFQATTSPRIMDDYIDTGKVRFVSRDLPLSSHRDAFKAAEAARGVGDQEKFWELRDAILANTKPPAADVILDQASTLGLDSAIFHKCLDSGEYQTEVQRDADDASALDIRRTPNFVIGRAVGSWLDGVQQIGAEPFGAEQD